MTTNRHFLVAALRSEAFVAGDTTTDFIARIAPSRAAALTPAECRHAAVAAAMWLQAAERQEARTLGWMPSGWRHGRLPPERAELAVETAPGQVEVTVSYRPRRDGSFTVRADQPAVAIEAAATMVAGLPGGDRADQPAGADVEAAAGSPEEGGVEQAGAVGVEAAAVISAWSPDALDIEWNGRRVGYAVAADGKRLHLTGDSETVTVAVLPRFGAPDRGLAAGGFAAPMPGVIIEVRVTPGEQVAGGTTLVVMEGMKMEHHVTAPCDGKVVEVLVNPGDQVDNGSPLLVFEAAEASAAEDSDGG